MKSIEGVGFNELTHVDFLQIKEGRGDEKNISHILVVTDHFTRMAQAYLCPNEKAHTVARVLLTHFCHYGFPAKLITDQAQCFTGKVIQELCRLAGISKLRTTEFHPQGNGQAEKFNSTLLSMLGTLQGEYKDRWRTQLRILSYAYNCTVNHATGYSPFELKYGYRANLPLDGEYGLPALKLRGDEITTNARGYLRFFKRKMAQALEIAHAKEKQQNLRARKHYNKTANAAVLLKGDRVLVLLNVKQSKLDNRWGEKVFVVTKTPPEGNCLYRIEPEDGEGPSRLTHRKMLRPIGLLEVGGAPPSEEVDILNQEEDQGSQVSPLSVRGPITRDRAKRENIRICSLLANPEVLWGLFGEDPGPWVTPT